MTPLAPTFAAPTSNSARVNRILPRVSGQREAKPLSHPSIYALDSELACSQETLVALEDDRDDGEPCTPPGPKGSNPRRVHFVLNTQVRYADVYNREAWKMADRNDPEVKAARDILQKERLKAREQNYQYLSKEECDMCIEWNFFKSKEDRRREAVENRNAIIRTGTHLSIDRTDAPYSSSSKWPLTPNELAFANGSLSGPAPRRPRGAGDTLEIQPLTLMTTPVEVHNAPKVSRGTAMDAETHADRPGSTRGRFSLDSLAQDLPGSDLGVNSSESTPIMRRLQRQSLPKTSSLYGSPSQPGDMPTTFHSSAVPYDSDLTLPFHLPRRLDMMSVEDAAHFLDREYPIPVPIRHFPSWRLIHPSDVSDLEPEGRRAENQNLPTAFTARDDGLSVGKRSLRRSKGDISDLKCRTSQS
ncbi:hypothetical protein PHLCEN_2v2502 [Hermanssonia centrifuga]|uniref:Uncharacterized protein n=1 Tax=Hermanssonia centrifuga TaxID=98765 RepID=A0A2R6RLS0_9APHY|nr:hypothetical protein PHLCEN_2v2502 [Hermanssonia centrifuga]